MIQVSGISKAFGDRTIFENVDWQVSKQDRVGLCGANGSGKTTLLRMLAGLESADSGRISRPTALTIGYLPQDGLQHAGRTVLEEARTAFQPLLDVKSEMHRLESRLEDPHLSDEDHSSLLSRYSDLQDRFQREDGYAIDQRAAAVLRGLGFDREDFDREASVLSGGWQMRLALARLLLLKPQLLLLDEPTNHLDIEARNWLESYLAGYPHAVVLVSHDRYFLDTVVSRIAEVGLQTLTDYHCDYSRYEIERKERLERLREARRRQDEEIARHKQFIERFRYQAPKAPQVQSRIKMLEKIVPIVVPPERKKVHFTFPAAEKSGRVVVEFHGMFKAYGDIHVFRGIDLYVERDERIAIVGPNGAGKSTLMRLIAGVEAPDAGERIEGYRVQMQYYAQDEASRLDPDLTVYETLEAGSPHEMIPAIRNILGGFLFSGDDIYKRVAVLSGGERTRLAVARMLLLPSNTLLLDEATNHLDLDSKEVLLDALMNYGGTLIFVSHDRYFLDKLATKIVEVGHGDAAVFPGTYEEFLHHKALAAAALAAEPETPGGAEAATAAATAGAEAWEERKRAASETRKRERALKTLQTQIEDVEAQIADREQSIRDLETMMALPEFYDDRSAVRAHTDRHQALKAEVEQLMRRWEELHAGIDEARPNDG
ncbi:MAG: ABC-F family ATP-binding cassette domain-containing protein [Acidobacteriota bacterium]